MTDFRLGRTFFGVLLTLVLTATMLIPASASAERGGYGADKRAGDAMVVANRGSGDISVINTRTLDVQTFDLPGDAEPMYVNHDPRNDVVYVGDRASSSIVVLDDSSYDVVATIPVGDGVFHQWYDRRARQLWVVGDTSQTVSVIDTRTLTVETVIDMPADLVDQGARPHDVFVSGKRAFVSLLGPADGSGVVLQYSTRTFEETGRITVGGDPHLFVDGNKLYVASQDASTVSRYNARNLDELGSISVPDAHGIFITNRGEVLATNIAGGGADAIWELNKRLSKVRAVTDTAVATPHNLSVDRNRQVFVTHSGPDANQVSVIDLERRGFGEAVTITVGTNPFGLGFVRG